MTIINESGLYSVILRSDKPEAKAFKRWVTHEVLPSIRRTGRYELDGQTAPMALQGPGAAPLPLSASGSTGSPCIFPRIAPGFLPSLA